MMVQHGFGSVHGITILMSETVNPKENLIEIYNSDYCITLDELPDLKTYPLDSYGNDETTPSEDETTTVEVSTSDEVSSVTETSEVTSTESTPSEGTGSDIVTILVLILLLLKLLQRRRQK